ncbi:MAG: ABC transporter ATP-binding protein [Burkholderiaceae bacterium]|nr:ABC transporter ATP-binding protein [Burkholderiaceae bacterium]
MSILKIDEVTCEFAGVRALDCVGFHVNEGSITSLIGPNGAGKTTLINIITGVLRPTSGRLFFNSEAVDTLKPNKIATLGIRRTFQTVRLFPGLTVLENIIIGQFAGITRRSPLLALFPTGSTRRNQKKQACELMEQFGLSKHMNTVATELSYGTQRRVEIIRALAGRPKLLLLDEPAAGMNEIETEQLQTDIRAVRDSGVTVFLIEHDMKLVMTVSDQIIVLNFGKKIAEGTPDMIRKDPEVIRSYLGN